MPNPAYAAITLGSNSFNMLVARTVGGQPKVLAKYKRKVRLAEGIEADGSLNQAAFERGLDCRAMFANLLVEHQVGDASGWYCYRNSSMYQ